MRRLLFLLFFFCKIIYCQELSFYQESINFSIDNTDFTVSGMYYFKNNSSRDLYSTVYYPYAFSAINIDTISIMNFSTNQPIKAVIKNDMHVFDLFLPSNDTCVLNIRYSHKHNDSLVTYILESTKFWNKAFDKADYTLRVIEKLEVDSMFMPPDTAWLSHPYKYYRWEHDNFMPKSNFNIHFSKIE